MSRAFAQHYRAGDNCQFFAGRNAARIFNIGQTLAGLHHGDKKISLELDAASESKINFSTPYKMLIRKSCQRKRLISGCHPLRYARFKSRQAQLADHSVLSMPKAVTLYQKSRRRKSEEVCARRVLGSSASKLGRSQCKIANSRTGTRCTRRQQNGKNVHRRQFR